MGATDAELGLDTYRRGRDRLLERIGRLLAGDSRVRAAWLWGSLGRGGADALSDLDVWVVVADEYVAELAAQRHTFVARAGRPLLTVEAPQNAPVKGAYLLALYPGEAGPHQVDWYWQAESAAQVPPGTRMLVERVSLPRSDAGPRFPGAAEGVERTPAEQIAHQVAFFWAMMPVVAKYVAHSPRRDGIELLELVRAPLAEVREFLGAAAADGTDDVTADRRDPAKKLATLRAMVDEMDRLMPEAARQGVPVPAPDVARQCRLYLDLVEAIVRAVW